MNMRDPILYRIRKTVHHRTGSAWNIYPMYDYAHPISDAIEGVTHSICTLEFEDHRPLYEWTLRALQTPAQPQQIEFARLNIDYTVMSKRRLLQLVQDKLVDGWDDPRMPTIKGMRRRGYRPQAIRNFADRVGVTRKNSVIALSTLEHAVREDLDEHSARAFAVLRPVRVRLTNYPGEGTEILRAPRHPKYPERGEREIPFGRELWIEEDDFAENPPPGFQRLRPGGRVRLRYAFVIRCEEVIKDPTGRVVEIRCAYEPDTKGGVNPPGRPKPDGIIHWVEVSSALRAEVRLYDRLFSDPSPDMHEGKDFREFINRDSLTKLTEAVVEPSVGGLPPESHVQFERLGFFCTDMVDHDPERRRVFNRTVTLRDTWAVTAPKGPL
jgi:glutaminyl-tRNA synthetase